MVEKITLFEPHFDNAQFGPDNLGELGILDRGSESKEEQSRDGGDSEESEKSGSRLGMFGKGLGTFLLMFGALWFVLSRMGGEDDTDERIEIEEGEEKSKSRIRSLSPL